MNVYERDMCGVQKSLVEYKDDTRKYHLNNLELVAHEMPNQFIWARYNWLQNNFDNL